ncbi:MAG: DNA-processing protein DprA, partial [candidate division Zixibacteria bacterium]
VYPSAHRDLAAEISRSGCLVSEFPRRTMPERHNFPIRNRIIAGLSDGVVVVEAAERSGALVTAGIALEQNREVFAVPGSADSEMSFGTNNLIKQGAVPVTIVDDILANFNWHKSEFKVKRTMNLSKLTEEELSLYNQLSIQPIHLDEIGKKISLGPSKTAELLLNLELKGFILRKPGNFVVTA